MSCCQTCSRCAEQDAAPFRERIAELESELKHVKAEREADFRAFGNELKATNRVLEAERTAHAETKAQVKKLREAMVRHVRPRTCGEVHPEADVHHPGGHGLPEDVAALLAETAPKDGES